jgi:hypothetical protein
VGFGEVMSKWRPGRWWRLLDKDGELKAETSNPVELARFIETGDIIQNLHIKDQPMKWIDTSLPEKFTPEYIAQLKEDYREIMDDSA